MKDNYASYGCDVLAAIFTGAQTDELLKYISLGLTILATLVSIFFSVYFGIKKARANDGKVEPAEVQEIAKDVIDQFNDMQSEINGLQEQLKEKDDKIVVLRSKLVRGEKEDA